MFHQLIQTPCNVRERVLLAEEEVVKKGVGGLGGWEGGSGHWGAIPQWENPSDWMNKEENGGPWNLQTCSRCRQ